MQTSQMAVFGSEGTVGWDSASLQAAASARPERAVVRTLLTAIVLTAGPPGDRRHVLLQPLTLGFVEHLLRWRSHTTNQTKIDK